MDLKGSAGVHLANKSHIFNQHGFKRLPYDPQTFSVS